MCFFAYFCNTHTFTYQLPSCQEVQRDEKNQTFICQEIRGCLKVGLVPSLSYMYKKTSIEHFVENGLILLKIHYKKHLLWDTSNWIYFFTLNQFLNFQIKLTLLVYYAVWNTCLQPCTSTYTCGWLVLTCMYTCQKQVMHKSTLSCTDASDVCIFYRFCLFLYLCKMDFFTQDVFTIPLKV